MKRFKPVRNRSNKRLMRKHSVPKHCIQNDSKNALSLVDYSVKEMTEISGTKIKRPVNNRRTKKEDGSVLSTYKETGLYSMVEAEGNQLT